MRNFVLIAILALLPRLALAELQLFACEPEWAALATEIGGDAVAVTAATTARQDPHRIEARPSLIARLRQADLLLCSGAELESGWLPMLLRQAGNAKVVPGQSGYLEAAMVVERLEVPAERVHALADVHNSGNPHVHLDPRRIGRVAAVLAERLATLDAERAGHYRDRLARFEGRWREAIARWEQKAAPLKGKRYAVHHRDWVYLFDWLGMEEAGTLEPAPGLPPSAGHLAELKAALTQKPAVAVLRTAYQEARPSEWLSEQAGLPALELPYTVGGAPGADDLFGLFEVTIERLLGAGGAPNR